MVFGSRWVKVQTLGWLMHGSFLEYSFLGSFDWLVLPNLSLILKLNKQEKKDANLSTIVLEYFDWVLNRNDKSMCQYLLF